MKSLWQWFVSTRMTIVISLLIVADVLIGTILLSAYSDVFSTINLEVFFFWLFDTGIDNIGLSWWIFLLLALLTLLTLNTVACLIDSLAAIVVRRRKGHAIARRLLSQAVHLGFVIVLVGHLVSSVAGFRTTGNRLYEGATIAMPGAQGLSLRLNRLDVAYSKHGYMKRMDAALSLLSDNQVIKEQIVRLNEPLLYRGNAVYIEHHGKTPQGIRLRVLGNGADDSVLVKFRGRRGSRFHGYRIVPGRLIPDFIIDSAGKAISASREFRNPALELKVFKGDTEWAKGWVFMKFPNRRALAFDGYEFFFSGLDFLPYAVLTINKDPGAIIALIGVLLFMGALIILLFIRDEGAELVTGRDTPQRQDNHLKTKY